MDPLISVIMSVHNEKEYVSDAINSILAQTYQNFELIIIDDYSDNETADICNVFYKNWPTKIRLFRNEHNIGLTKSLNIGLKHAKGDFIARMDADDISLNNRFETQINYLIDNSDIDLVGSFYDEIDKNGKTIRENVKFETEPSIINWRLFFENPIPHPPIMLKKEILNNMGGYNEKIKFSQDYDLFCRLSAFAKMTNLPKVLYKWRVHDKSISKKSNLAQRKIAVEISKNHISSNINSVLDDYDLDLLWNKNIRNSNDRKRYVELLYQFYLATLKKDLWSKYEIIKLKKYIISKLYYHLSLIDKDLSFIFLLLKIFFIRPRVILKMIYKSITL